MDLTDTQKQLLWDTGVMCDPDNFSIYDSENDTEYDTTFSEQIKLIKEKIKADARTQDLCSDDIREHFRTLDNLEADQQFRLDYTESYKYKIKSIRELKEKHSIILLWRDGRTIVNPHALHLWKCAICQYEWNQSFQSLMNNISRCKQCISR